MKKLPTQELQKVRPELNLEKWTIWQPTNSRNQADEKIMQRKINLPDGSQLSTKVEVVYTTKGVLTTEDQKVYYALIKLWEEQNKPMHETYFSLREVARILSRSWGSDTSKGIEQSLMRLRITSFIWENSFYDNVTKEKHELLEAFNILSELKINRREKTEKGGTKYESSSFRFNEHILRNLHAGYTKPTLLDVIIGFQSEIAQLLYSRIDLLMADKDSYERKTKELFEDLGLLRPSYSRPGKRKQMLEKALEELEGSPLSTGIITSASLEKTQDETDYKVVIHKQPDPNTTEEEKTILEPEFVLTPQLPFKPTRLNIDTKLCTQLLDHFYRTFHKITKSRYTRKEINQATRLINLYNYEAAKYIIDYSHKNINNSLYTPQTLLGIMEHTEKALAEYNRLNEQTNAETAIATCEICDENGFVTLVDTDNNHFRTKCLHNLKLMEEMEQRRGCRRLKSG